MRIGTAAVASGNFDDGRNPVNFSLDKSAGVSAKTRAAARRQGLPLHMVAQTMTEHTSWRARRASDDEPDIVVTGRYVQAAEGLEISLEGDADEAALLVSQAHSLTGLRLLQRHQADGALAALEGLGVEIINQHEYFMDINPELSAIGLDYGLAKQLGLKLQQGKVEAGDLEYELSGRRFHVSGEEVLHGFSLLSAMGHLHEACHKTGSDERDALHRMLDFYFVVARDDPSSARALIRLLRTPFLDSGNVFALCMESVADASLAKEVDDYDIQDYLTLSFQQLKVLGDGLASDPTIDALTRISADAGLPEDAAQALLKLARDGSIESIVADTARTIKWKDKWVTWLIGQSRVDMPYSLDVAFDLLREREGEDIDEARRAIHRALAGTYDRETEGANIERISREIEEEGRMIVCGRISRAFGNQTQLLSSATYVDRENLIPAATELNQSARDIPSLQTQVARLTKLVLQEKPTSYAQLRGGIWHLEEAIRTYQSDSTKQINEEKEADAERLVGRRGFGHYQDQLVRLNDTVKGLSELANTLRGKLEAASRSPAAFLILQQRFFPGETQLMALANANRDTHPGKIEVLRDLTRKGGHNRYASEGSGQVVLPDGQVKRVSWVSKCQHWIEAIPLFIKERIIQVPVKAGGQDTVIERVETEVDQRGMEAFFRFAAQFWAENCNEVMDSEHVALAREFLVTRTCADDVEKLIHEEQVAMEEACLRLVRANGLASEAGAVAALIAYSHGRLVESVGIRIEKDQVTRYEALKEILFGKEPSDSEHNLIGQLAATSGDDNICAAARSLVASHNLGEEARRLASLAHRKRRPISTLHILTTESAGMTEGYVQTWLETEMAFYNVVKANGWEGEVKEKIRQYRTRVDAIAERVIGELGMEVMVQEAMRENDVPRPAALGIILSTNRPVAEEVACIAVLIEEEERLSQRPVDLANTQDPARVDQYIEAHRDTLADLAARKVVEENGRIIHQQIEDLMARESLSNDEAVRRVIDADDDLKGDLDFYIRSLARREVLEELDAERPELNILNTQDEYLRNHTQLAQSFARREVIAAHNAQGLTEDPLYNYRAGGGKKKYNLLYAPSRVDLGSSEMESIVRWAQWVGGADESACNAGREFYSLINEAGVEVRPALAWQEIQKPGENANMTAGKAFANALALLINSVGEGDQQVMADQMALRHDEDRGTPPASEGYGGYCVPKDGLFLAFVLELKNETKLRQMGIPATMHAVTMALAKEAVLRYHDFETDFEWQLWVARKLLSDSNLKAYISNYIGIGRLKAEDVLIFNIAKIAEVIQHLGQPWHEITPGDHLISNLAAQWAANKVIIGGEQVQRFMVFYKAWIIARALREAGRAGEGRIVLSAEYKPVQDIRYSAGNRIFEVLCQTGEHLTYSLDEAGQNLVHLMIHGFKSYAQVEEDSRRIHRLREGSTERLRLEKILDKDRRTAHMVHAAFGLDAAGDGEAIQRLNDLFPACLPPADIRLVSSTMSSTQDVLNYTDDTQLTQIADRVEQVLMDIGLNEDTMRANAEVYGGELGQWAGIKQLPEEQKQALLKSNIVYRVGKDTFQFPLRGAIHPLVLRLRGPGRIYDREVQGADVLNTGVAFEEILDLIDNPPKLVALMLEGNPDSALAITDGVSGRAARMLTYQDVMLFLATCEKLTGQERGIYKAMGVGRNVVRRLRRDMQVKRERARDLLEALDAVASATAGQAREAAITRARKAYSRIVTQVVDCDEAQEAISEEERVKRYKRHKDRDHCITGALLRLSLQLELGHLDFGTWLASGGMYVIAAAPEKEVIKIRAGFEEAVSMIPTGEGSRASAATPDEIEDTVRALVKTEFIPESQRFEQVLGRETSSKAVHEAAAEARERRKALRVRLLRAQALNQREEGFKDTIAGAEGKDFDECFSHAHGELAKLVERLQALFAAQDPDARISIRAEMNRTVGTFLAHARQGLVAVVEELAPVDSPLHRQSRETFLENIHTLYTGREIIFEEWKKIAGGYQDMGDIARLVSAVADDDPTLKKLAEAIELFYVTFAISQTIEHVQMEHEQLDWIMFWDELTIFFAETVNDHDCVYRPWNYVRGVKEGMGFDRLNEQELYALAVERHQWLYQYIRLILTQFTELKELPREEQDALLGNFLEGNEIAGIGADAPTKTERAWRAYNQLRELSFMHNDGFGTPVVFTEFDPGIIQAGNRVNIVFLFPVGRTHISRVLREGPTLNRELAAQGSPGANIIATRHDEFRAAQGAKKNVLICSSGHLYVSEEEFVQALVRHKNLSPDEARQQAEGYSQAGALTPKGIRIAARFTAPVVGGLLVPYHENSLYTSGQLEDEGLPYAVQSLICSDITYDKSLYPEIFKDSGVEMPPEIDWLMPWQQGLSREEALAQITEGRNGFTGLREFSERYPIVLIKGAAESGARNLRVFEIGKGKGAWDEEELEAAAAFIYERAGKQNMVVQEAVRSSPEFWASQFYMSNFVDRQIIECSQAVIRDKFPRPQIYGSLRIIASSSHPSKPYDLTHLIALASLQVATNVGRGGTLEPLYDDFVQEGLRTLIKQGLAKEAPLAMKALAEFAQKYEPEFKAARARDVGSDLRGVPYSWPAYLMLDYLFAPEFEREGKLVDIAPRHNGAGERIGSRIILEDKDGRFEAKMTGCRFIHLEPNVGIGLMDRYNLREEEREKSRAREEGRPFNWDAVGTDDRIVLRNFAIAGQEYLEAAFGDDYFASEGNESTTTAH